jgi:hypothetical protein
MIEFKLIPDSEYENDRFQKENYQLLIDGILASDAVVIGSRIDKQDNDYDIYSTKDKISEALAVYLNLPASPIVYNDSFSAMRLQQQIENLQHSQRMAVRELQVNEKLLIAQSDMIREKNVTISQLQSVNEQQQKIIEKISSKSIMMDSVENKEEFEKVFDGLEFGTSKELKEKLGIKFNPVTSLKTIAKKLTGADDEITSLNLNNEVEK